MNETQHDTREDMPASQNEFERLIGEPVSTRSYVPKMELTARQRRDLPDVRRRLLDEARMMGEAAYYGWGAGKDKIEGPSVKLAMAAARCWGNCSVEAMPLQETRDAYVFTSRFLDLETGFTLERQFRQSKAWMVYGKMDGERKGDIRFQIGQSKAARNLVLNALPEWLIDEAVTTAKEGCREKVEKLVETKGIAVAVDMILAALIKEGTTEPAILSKCGIAKREGLKVDDIVMLRGCLKAIQDGAERASELFPSADQPKPTDLAERAKAMAAKDKAALKPESVGDDIAADAVKEIAEQSPAEFSPDQEFAQAIRDAKSEAAAKAAAAAADEAGFPMPQLLADKLEAMRVNRAGKPRQKE